MDGCRDAGESWRRRASSRTCVLRPVSMAIAQFDTEKIFESPRRSSDYCLFFVPREMANVLAGSV